MTIAGRTFLELQEEVLEFQFNAPKYRPLVKRWLNDAQRKVVQQSEARTQQDIATISAIAGDRSYALPEDFGRIIDIFRPESGHLAPLGVRDFDALPASSGAPTRYLIAGTEVHFDVTPDGAYEVQMRYWRLPADMVEDADEPEIPPQYHDLLVAYALHRAYAKENDYAASTFWKGEWEAGLLKMRGEVQHDTFDGPKRVGGSWAPSSAGPQVSYPR